MTLGLAYHISWVVRQRLVHWYYAENSWPNSNVLFYQKYITTLCISMHSYIIYNIMCAKCLIILLNHICYAYQSWELVTSRTWHCMVYVIRLAHSCAWFWQHMSDFFVTPVETIEWFLCEIGGKTWMKLHAGVILGAALCMVLVTHEWFLCDTSD